MAWTVYGLSFNLGLKLHNDCYNMTTPMKYILPEPYKIKTKWHENTLNFESV